MPSRHSGHEDGYKAADSFNRLLNLHYLNPIHVLKAQGDAIDVLSAPTLNRGNGEPDSVIPIKGFCLNSTSPPSPDPLR